MEEFSDMLSDRQETPSFVTKVENVIIEMASVDGNNKNKSTTKMVIEEAPDDNEISDSDLGK